MNFEYLICDICFRYVKYILEKEKTGMTEKDRNDRNVWPYFKLSYNFEKIHSYFKKK